MSPLQYQVGKDRRERLRALKQARARTTWLNSPFPYDLDNSPTQSIPAEAETLLADGAIASQLLQAHGSNGETS